MELLSPITYNNNIYQTTDVSYSYMNLDYAKSEHEYAISVKFYQQLPTISTIPVFNPQKFDDWNDRMKSFLRSCFSLDCLIKDKRELKPIQLVDESIEDFEKRMNIFSSRNKALYLILDKSLSTAGGSIDSKFLALSEKLNESAELDRGQQLYDGIIFLLKGSHLWARLDSISSMNDLKLDKVGSEQAIFNRWKRESEIQSSLQLDLVKAQKLMLIKALNARKEHKTVMLQLAAMNPEELFNLSAQQILDRFLASAGHQQGGAKEAGDSVALIAEVGNSSGKRKVDTESIVCYFCHQPGHIKSNCPKWKKSKKGGKSEKKEKKA